MDEIKKVEFEIEKLRARMLLFERTAKVLNLPKEMVEREYDNMLDILSKLIEKRDKLKE